MGHTRLVHQDTPPASEFMRLLQRTLFATGTVDWTILRAAAEQEAATRAQAPGAEAPHTVPAGLPEWWKVYHPRCMSPVPEANLGGPRRPWDLCKYIIGKSGVNIEGNAKVSSLV